MRFVAALVGLLTVVGCTAGASPATTTPSGPRSASTTVAPAASVTATVAATPQDDPALVCAAQTVEGLSLDERVGQPFMVGVTSVTPAEIAVLRRSKIGSVILMANGGVQQTLARTKRLPRAAGLPMLVATDQEGGLVQRLRGAGFSRIPDAVVQARLSDAELRKLAASWAAELKAAGVQVDLAPVADVVPVGMTGSNAPIGKLRRGYGSDPAKVAKKVAAFVAGMADAGVATSVKHFPGIGKVTGNTDFTANVVDTTTTADDPGFVGFAAATEAGAAMVMISTVTYRRIDPRHQAVYSPTLIALARTRLGFDGVLISDDLGAAAALRAIPASQRGLRFIRAGGDLVINVVPGLTQTMVSGLAAAARKDPILADRVTESATRVLTVKVRLGLVRCG